MYTLFLRYTIDPNKLADWRSYAQAEFGPITESGGRITGDYAPSSPGLPAKRSPQLMWVPWPNMRCIAPS